MPYKKGQSGNPKGRPKGAKDKKNHLIKDMILKALEDNGGVKYLSKQAKENPNAFLTLLGKILPLQITGEGGDPIQTESTVQAGPGVLGVCEAVIAASTTRKDAGSKGGDPK